MLPVSVNTPQFNVDLALVVGALDELSVFRLAADGERRRNADEVVSGCILHQGIDRDRAGIARHRVFPEAGHGLDQAFAAKERDLFELR